MKKKKISGKILCFLLLFVMTFSSLYVTGEAGVKIGKVNRCIFILGDSRTCGINRALRSRLEEYEVYTYYDVDIRDAVYKMNDTVIVLCAEAGGGYENGSFEKSVERMLQIIDKYDAISQATEYICYNLYGINDIICESISNNSYPSRYLEKDKDIRNLLGEKCDKFYQFNVGPVYEEGWVSGSSSLNNEIIVEYNSLFESNEYVEVVNLNGFLKGVGLTDFDNAPDDSGLHYSDDINEEILKLIIALSQPKG